MQHEAGDYPEAAEIYDYDHGKDRTNQDSDYQGADEYGSQEADKDYYSTYMQYSNANANGHHQNQEGEGEMW